LMEENDGHLKNQEMRIYSVLISNKASILEADTEFQHLPKTLFWARKNLD